MRGAGPLTTDLLQQARAGSPEALEVLFARCAGRLLPIIRLRMGAGLRAHLESRDLLQATLLRAFQRLDQLRGEESASLWAWLARIAEHEIRDQAAHLQRQRRDVRRQVALPEEPAAPSVRSLASRMVRSEEAHQLERALESLTVDQREVILLRRYEELGFAEVGERLNRSPDACRMLYARALAALTLALEGPA